MNDPSQEELLGYVLGALDADQQRELQQKIDNDPQLDEKLIEVKSQLMPLELLDESSGSRPGLARRTCEMVASFNSQYDSQELAAQPQMPAKPVKSFDDARELRPTSSSWSKSNMLVTAASLAVFASLLFPLVAYTKHRSQIAHCANNLRSIGCAFASFSEFNDGKFVEIPSEGPLAFVGIVAPVLKEAGLVEQDNWFTCQGVGRDEPFAIPSTKQITMCASGDQQDYFRRNACGDYGYSCGHMDNDKYVSPGNLSKSYQIICADQPSVRIMGGPSDNHRGQGQNCLFGDFHIEFVKGNARGNDQIYVNAYNVVGPGISPRDTVIGASHLSPLQAPQMNRVIYTQPN